MTEELHERVARCEAVWEIKERAVRLLSSGHRVVPLGNVSIVGNERSWTLRLHGEEVINLFGKVVPGKEVAILDEVLPELRRYMILDDLADA
jgi:hypothetical protein